MDYAADGDLTEYAPDDLADAVEWIGDPEELVCALVSSQFLDKGEGQLSIHDWQDYAGRLVEKRRQDAERKRKSRAFQGTSYGHPRDGAVTKPNQTKQNQTEQDVNVPSPSAPDSVPEDIPFAELPDDEPEPAVPDTPKAKRVPKPGAESIGRLNALYREHIQPKCRVNADDEIKRMLKTFTPSDLEQAIVHCRDDPWFMDNCAHRGAAWFFTSAKRMEGYVNGKKKESEHGAKRGDASARASDSASRRRPGEASPFGKFGGTNKPP